MESLDEQNRNFQVKVRKNRGNSLRVTLPVHINGLYDVEDGDWISLRFNGILKKNK